MHGKYLTQQARKIGLLSVRQRNAIAMAIRWWANSGPRLDAGWVWSGKRHASDLKPIRPTSDELSGVRI